MTIGIIAAMDLELNELKAAMADTETETSVRMTRSRGNSWQRFCIATLSIRAAMWRRKVISLSSPTPARSALMQRVLYPGSTPQVS